MSENIELVQLSTNRFVVAFNKNAIAGLREGKASAISVKSKGADLKFVFMRDSAYREKMGDFQRSVIDEFAGYPFWKRWWKKMRSKKKAISLHQSPNMTTRKVK